jgi:hypothetical protein
MTSALTETETVTEVLHLQNPPPADDEEDGSILQAIDEGVAAAFYFLLRFLASASTLVQKLIDEGKKRKK